MSDIMIPGVMARNQGHYAEKKEVKMNPVSRMLILIATLILPIAYFTPIWFIQLWAPQYPEGLEMQIWINKLTGSIDIINGLNHYIGMANIEESMFPELKFLSYILAGIIGLGLLTVIANKKWLLNTFTIIILLFAIGAMADMYIWGYKYGHNLDPHAAIKIEGESYQPPLIGYKQLLNFTALSAPDKGGWAMFGAGFLAILAFSIQMIRDRKVKRSLVNRYTIILFSLLLPSCQSGPEKINYGADDCAFCGMKLVDTKYGCELITTKGKVFKFDDVNCMLNYEKENPAEYKNKLITDFAAPATLINAETAYYLNSPDLRTPMGSNIAAFGNQDSLKKINQTFNGETLSWPQVYDALSK